MSKTRTRLDARGSAFTERSRTRARGMMDRPTAMAALRAVRESLVAMSRRHSRVADEVEDVAHDIIVSALRRGTALDSEAFLRSAHAAARRHAALLARSAGRRRAREARSADDGGVHGHGSSGPDSSEGAPLSALPPALQTTLLLLAQGLDKAELLQALGLSDAALRSALPRMDPARDLHRNGMRIAARGGIFRRVWYGYFIGSTAS